MRIQRLGLAIGLGVALNITFGAAPVFAQDNYNPPNSKPPKPPKSDNTNYPNTNYPNTNPYAGIVGGADASWMANVPATRTALYSGIITAGTGQTSCPDIQAELLGVLAGSGDLSVSGAVATLPSREAGCAQSSSAIPGDATALRSALVRNLTDAGAPVTEASGLADAMTGILAQPRSGQLAESVDQFNKLVKAAPDNFLANPPAPFLAIHAVLARLLGVEAAK